MKDNPGKKQIVLLFFILYIYTVSVRSYIRTVYKQNITHKTQLIKHNTQSIAHKTRCPRGNTVLYVIGIEPNF